MDSEPFVPGLEYEIVGIGLGMRLRKVGTDASSRGIETRLSKAVSQLDRTPDELQVRECTEAATGEHTVGSARCLTRTTLLNIPSSCHSIRARSIREYRLLPNTFHCDT